MKYQLHDAPDELWAWVKGRAHIAGLTINDFVLAILKEEKFKQVMHDRNGNSYDTPTHTPFNP